MGGRMIIKNVLAFVLIFATVCAATASKNGHANAKRDHDDNDDGIYGGGAMKWAASVSPFSDDGEGRHRFSSDLICDSTRDCRERTSKVIGKAKETCHAVQEEAGQVKGKLCETAREAVHLTEEAVGRAKHKANAEKDVIANAVAAGHKAAKKMATTLGHDIAGNVTRAIEGGGLGSVVNLFASASAFGQGLWVTLIWGPSLKTNFPRQQLQMVESQMYKLYFKTMSSTVAMALVGHWLSPRNTDSLQSFNLLASLLMLLLNLAFLNPLSQRVVRDRIKMEKEMRESTCTSGGEPIVEEEAATTTTTTASSAAAEETLDRRTKRLNLYSSLLNAMSLSAITWHLYYLCHRLSATT